MSRQPPTPARPKAPADAGELPDSFELGQRPERMVWAIAAFATLALAGGLGWMCWYSSSIPFLASGSAARWIVYPAPPDTMLHTAADLPCEFRRKLEIGAMPRSARLHVRSFRRAAVLVNGQPMKGEGQGAGWKAAREHEVTSLLRTGANEISVVVSNAQGPPALWLHLAGVDPPLATDGTWEASLAGAAWAPAQIASAPPGAFPWHGEKTNAQSLLAVWPILLAFAAAACVLVLAGLRVVERSPAQGGSGSAISDRVAALVVGAAAVSWCLLFWNNSRSLTMSAGFDAVFHKQYIDYIRERGALPLPDEGWETYQPPLYYLVSAVSLVASGASPASPEGLGFLRAVGLVAGIAQLALIMAGLRSIIPGRPLGQIAGFVLGAFVPVHLYLYQFLTNETLAATLASASVYLFLRLLRAEAPSWKWSAAAGAMLGCAMLAKLTAILLVPVFTVVLAGRLLARRTKDASAWVQTVVLPLSVCLVVSGWHYARVALRFGSPFVGNWDAAVTAPWWQDPGFRTASYYFRFGTSLVEPFYSGFHGFLDGLYATFWGDGLLSGVAEPSARQAWNYDLMRAGYLLALLPTLLIAVGACVAAASLARRPRADGFALAGLALLTGVAVVAISLRIPSYAQVKAFYGLVAMMPICACAGYGFEWLARRRRILAMALSVGLGLWAVNSYASFWIRRGTVEAITRSGVGLAFENRPADAEERFRQALQLDPWNSWTRLRLASALAAQEKTDEAFEETQEALRRSPTDPDALVAVAGMLSTSGKIDDALPLAERAVAADPADADAGCLLGSLLVRKGQPAHAIEVLRQALRSKPYHAPTHLSLGHVYSATGETARAIEHLRYAVGIQPSMSEARAWLAEVHVSAGRYQEALGTLREGLTVRADDLPVVARLAWLLATCPDDSLRNGVEAVRLTEGLARGPRPAPSKVYDALAAGYAEIGRYEEAAQVAGILYSSLTEARMYAEAEQVQRRRLLYESGMPYRLKAVTAAE